MFSEYKKKKSTKISIEKSKAFFTKIQKKTIQNSDAQCNKK